MIIIGGRRCSNCRDISPKNEMFAVKIYEQVGLTDCTWVTYWYCRKHEICVLAGKSKITS